LIKTILGVSAAGFKDKYLGLPTANGRMKNWNLPAHYEKIHEETFKLVKKIYVIRGKGHPNQVCYPSTTRLHHECFQNDRGVL
jgi:hypothetical protein